MHGFVNALYCSAADEGSRAFHLRRFAALSRRARLETGDSHGEVVAYMRQRAGWICRVLAGHYTLRQKARDHDRLDCT
jgi:hypothetical protein